MKRVILDRLPELHTELPLPDEEAHHLVQVLRARNGETAEALDGRGRFQSVEIRLTGKGRANVYALESPRTDPKRVGLPVILEMSVLKGDAMEWSVEKAVELGAMAFQPIIAAHSVVQMDKKGPVAFQERWQKIADQALKQCGRLTRMEVRLPLPLGEALQRTDVVRLWLNERNRDGAFPAQAVQERRDRPVSILVGPEGGWSENEIAFLSRIGAVDTSLGPWVLRAETAALFATSLVVGGMR